MGIWYTTREAVKSSTDSASVARDNVRVDRAADAASRTVERLLHRKFYPFAGTYGFDYPGDRYARSYRIWFDQFDLVAATSVRNGDGTTIDAANYFLYPQDGPPYEWIEINRGSTSYFSTGSTVQRAVQITGTWGWDNTTALAGTLAAGINASVTSLTVSSVASIGVGSLLTVGSERLVVTDKAQTGSGQNLSSDVDAKNATTTVPVGSGAAFAVGEEILIDSEKMLITDISGNNLTVERAQDGTVLAAHATGTAVYVPRVLTVSRAATGTTAASHSMSDPVYVQQYPGGIVQLATAIAANSLKQDLSGWSAVTGSGENGMQVAGGGLPALMKSAYMTYGRQGRYGAV